MDFQNKYVTDVYNEIAPHFNNTRSYLWKDIKEFMQNLTTRSFALEIGCGNGKNLLFRKDVISIGIDITENLLTICKDKGVEVLLGNCIKLPFKTNCFTDTISVAVIHHLPTNIERETALKEQIRVTKSGGRCFLQVWGDVDIKKEGKYIPLKNGEKGDYLVKWTQLNGKSHLRFYHLFTEKEFLQLLSSQKNKITNLKINYQFENWIATFNIL